MPWWAIMLIVIGAIILVVFMIAMYACLRLGSMYDDD